jgi:membrane dipeptidase
LDRSWRGNLLARLETCSIRRLTMLVLLSASSIDVATQAGQVDELSTRTRRLHERAIVIDTHADTTQRLLFEKGFDIARRNERGSIDIPRMREGGLDALFFSIWMPGDVTGPLAVKRAMQQIDRVRESVRVHSKDLFFATSVADIRRAASERKIAVLMGMEGGHMLYDDLGLLRLYAALGVRYLTLTHSLNTTWADSSGDKPVHNGLTSFGKDVVRELNRLGVMVDVSHVADKTFYDTLDVSKAPVVASHSSCRAISNSPRNMSDEMLRALAKNGGVIMINYNSAFLSEEFRIAAGGPEMTARLQAATKGCGEDQACSILEGQRVSQEAMRSGQAPSVTLDKIVEHIDHAVKVAGIDHVGLGSDFDGAVMPLGMEDASKLPRITDALLKRGYTEPDIIKILGGNLLHVMGQVEATKSQ